MFGFFPHNNEKGYFEAESFLLDLDLDLCDEI